MNLWLRWRYLLVCIGIIALALVAISILDIIIAVMYSRFYTSASFVVSFGVGGVFAGCGGYILSVEKASVKTEFTRWSLILLMIGTGLLFFFFLSQLENEYRNPFKAFGLMLALTSLIFIKGKVE